MLGLPVYPAQLHNQHSRWISLSTDDGKELLGIPVYPASPGQPLDTLSNTERSMNGRSC